MLRELLQKVVDIGGNAMEVEYENGKKTVYALNERGKDGTAISIARLDREESKRLFGEIEKWKRRKQVILSGVRYRLSFSKYESFMEWVYKIQINNVADTRSTQLRSKR